METRGTTGKETTSYWFDLPIDVAEFEEKLGVGAESGDYRIIEKVLPYADEVHEHTSVYQLNELDFMYHDFEVEKGSGPVLLGEVSQCNDDNTDNRFYEKVGRFPAIEEDEPPYRLLCNEYPKAR